MVHAIADDDSVIDVTATRSAVALDEVPSSITVLDKAAIDRSQDIGVTEILLRTPGITVSRNGGYGTATSFRIRGARSEEHTSELQSLMRISYAVFCLKKKTINILHTEQEK